MASRHNDVKVVVVSPGFPPDPGGVESVTGSIARHLVAQGQQVVVLTHGRKRQHETTSGKVEVYRYPTYLKEFAISPALAWAMRRKKNAIWHVHAVHSTLPALVWATKRRPYVLNPHFHGVGHTATARLIHVPYGPVLRRVMQSASAVIAVSQYEAGLLEARFGVPVEVIPNGVDLARLRSIIRTRENDGQVQLLVVARLSDYKRIDMVILALALLPEKYTLVVHGQGPEAGALERLASTMGVQQRVRFQNSHLRDEDLWQLMANADVLLNLSAAEAFSVAVLEALAVGTPVVLSASMALQEWSDKFPSEVTTVPDLTPEAVASAVEQTAGRRVTPDLSAYDWETVTSQLIDIYKRVLN